MCSAVRRRGPRLATLVSGAVTVLLVVIAVLIVLIAVPKVLHALSLAILAMAGRIVVALVCRRVDAAASGAVAAG